MSKVRQLKALDLNFERDADLMRCRHCSRALHINLDGEHLRHKDGCPNTELEPWLALRKILVTPDPFIERPDPSDNEREEKQ
ncbi:MAG: hypothetical protein RIB80_04835 [Rhodospirillales bacterium]